MSKGKKFNTPKKFWYKVDMRKRKIPWYVHPRYRYTHAHVMSKDHKKYKWFFRCKDWFNDVYIKRMSMRFPMSHEIWGWD